MPDEDPNIDPIEPSGLDSETQSEQLTVQTVKEPIHVPGVGLVQPRDIVAEMQKSYLDYAMSVIVARALPDVRDGLKPIHRRILFASNELGLRSTVKHKKSATIVGQVMAAYHPHGDVAIYDSLARMAQWFSMGHTLIDGQGNFGSMDGDAPAAMRYTEARLAKISDELLADIDKETVDFTPTFDGTTLEPIVLPTRVPNLLLNGVIGIAVGMATNVPTHNLAELCDGVIALIDKPEITVEELMKYIPGPDFPTGAEVYAGTGLREAYAAGRGKFVIRSVAEIEERKNGFRIVVTEIPYQVNKADMVAKIADLVKDKKIDGITDIRDETSREGIRIVIELRANSYPKKVLNRLYEMTPLQTAYHVNMLALVDTVEPRVLSLKEVLQEFVKHRQIVIRRRSEFELRKAKERAHILEGLLKALDAIDEVVAIIRSSKNRDEARARLMKRFEFSEIQANAILDMRLSSLVGLERQRLQDEYDEKMKYIAYLEDLLAHEEKILDLIRAETREIKEKYGRKRKTKIIQSDITGFTAEDLIPNEEVVISLTKTNYIKRVQRDTYRSQGRGGKGVVGMSTKEEDEVAYLLSAMTHDSIYFFTDQGKLYKTQVYEIPSTTRQSKGQSIVNVIQIGQDEKVTAVLTLTKEQEKAAGFFIMGTTDGTVKKTEISAYANVRKNGIIAIKLAPKNSLRWVKPSNGSDVVLMVTAKAQAILYKESDVRPTGRSAAGVRGMKLRPEDRVVAMDVLTEKDLKTATILVVFENGFGKRTPLSHFDIQNRGGMGIKAAAVTPRVGTVVFAEVVADTSGELMLISGRGTIIKTSMQSVKQLGRVTQGVTLMRLESGDRVVSAAVLSEKTEDEEG
ncbi:DNA gyrase subunit A [Patescibacteria group bacterium]|nr:DNA gyrase subunit A [Patescibacteria group bacterium]